LGRFGSVWVDRSRTLALAGVGLFQLHCDEPGILGRDEHEYEWAYVAKVQLAE
jgi:hypothetical protein